MNSQVIHRIALLCLTATCIAACVNKPKKTERQEQYSTAGIEAIVYVIDACPSWLRINEENKKVLFHQLQLLSGYKPNEVRAALDYYIEKRETSSEYYLDEYSKVYLINRYYCNVPEWTPKSESRIFGGWGGVPIKSSEVSLLWPFAKNENGKLDLIGSYHGYFGPRYLGLEEFDFLYKKYGTRAKLR